MDYDYDRLYGKLCSTGLFVTDGTRRRRVHYVPSNGRGSKAYIRPTLFGGRIECMAAGRNVLENLMRELRHHGWTECE